MKKQITKDDLINMKLMNTRMFQWNKGKQSKATGIGAKCDVIILNKTLTIFNKSINNVKTVFLNTRLAKTGYNLLYNLLTTELSNNSNLIVIIGGEDITFPNSVDKRHVPSTQSELDFYHKLVNLQNVEKFYIENLDSQMSPNVYPYPLGFSLREGPINMKFFLKYQNKNFNRPLKFTNMNRIRNGKGEWELRAKVNELCRTAQWTPFYHHTGLIKNYPKFLKTLASYPFTLAVNGGGIDPNPKIFEAMLVGTIPIVIKREPYTNVYKNMPVIVLENTWNKDTFTKKRLKKWYEQCKTFLENEDARNEVLYKLTLKYWWNYMTK